MNKFLCNNHLWDSYEVIFCAFKEGIRSGVGSEGDVVQKEPLTHAPEPPVIACADPFPVYHF